MIVGDEIVKIESFIDNTLFVLVDFPQKIQIPKNNWPIEIDDSSRKLQNFGGNNYTEILTSSNRLLSEVACLRVFAEPEFFSVITRYLHPESIEVCIKNVITAI
jgi:hypothetical protein